MGVDQASVKKRLVEGLGPGKAEAEAEANIWALEGGFPPGPLDQVIESLLGRGC